MALSISLCEIEYRVPLSARTLLNEAAKSSCRGRETMIPYPEGIWGCNNGLVYSKPGAIGVQGLTTLVGFMYLKIVRDRAGIKTEWQDIKNTMC